MSAPARLEITRDQFLALFLARPDPVDVRDLTGRAIVVRSVARVLAGVGDTPDRALNLAKTREVNRLTADIRAEALRCETEGLVARPRPNIDDAHRAPPSAFQLTAVGAEQAWEVWLAIRPEEADGGA